MDENQQPINPFLEKIMAKLEERRVVTDSDMTNHQDPELVRCGLANIDCPICHNMGRILRQDENGCMIARECKCMEQRRAIRRINSSGLQDLTQRYSFDNYETPTSQHEHIKKKAMEFVKAPAECFILAGRSGSGKTHICTAICNQLMADGWNLKYMMWRTEAAELKAMVNEREEYKQSINRLRNVPILYIDDFWKGTVTDADINLAFTILNDRYNSKNKKTIISTELPMEEIIRRDEAIGGRIAERARGYTLQAPNINWRTRDR